jgi:hypothetical protein
MTAPVMPLPGTGKLGPGRLTIGETGTEIDCSCLVNNASIAPSKNATDPTTKLCGSVRPGTVRYTYQLTGNVDTDLGSDSGLFALSWSAAGTSQPFTFTPSDDLGTVFSGTLTIDPLTAGAGAQGDDLTSDIAFDIAGQPTVVYGTVTP